MIYGHENGITLVWRGGRRLKQAKEQPKQHKQNGANAPADDAVMIIDSDEEEPPKKGPLVTAYEDKPEFEDAPEDESYPEVIQTLDLTLGTPVLNVAVLPIIPSSAKEAAASSAGAILGERMAFAVSCVTNDAYVITLPLTPPSHESKARPELRTDLLAGKAGSGAWGESLILLSGQTRPSDGIAISLVKPATTEKTAKPLRAVVAAHSRQASGVLQLWDVPLDPKAKPSRSLEPFQTEFLPSPLTSISFNPTHATQLLTASSTHAARIYDYALSSLPPDPDAVGPFPGQGSWLLSLYQPFAKPSSTRKPLLDASWISHGKAVFALLADGMWGIWDISSINSSLHGAALTAFSVSGYVEGTGSLRSITSQQKENQTGEFAPMTPHTRRQATATLKSVATLDRLAAMHGGVKVTALPAYGKALQPESLALWIGGLEHVCVIPNVSRFWESQLRKGSNGANLFSGAQTTKMLKVHELSTGLLGEPCCGVGIIPAFSKDRNRTVQDGGLSVDVVVRGETRLVVVRDSEEGSSRTTSLARGKRLFSREQPNAIIVHGENDKNQRMSFNLSTAKPGSLRLKSLPPVDAMDEDEDMMQLPSQSRAGFNFASTINDAADVTADLSRDVEAEMLGIMEIDNALESLEGNGSKRASGRRKVFFEED